MSTREHLQAILDNRGTLTPSVVVEEASDESHPLHSRFKWDDAEAAHSWRLEQAAQLIRSVKVTREAVTDDGQVREITVRAFVAQQEMEGLPLSDDTVGTYLPVEAVAASSDLTTAWFRGLERDWHSLRRRAGDSRLFTELVAEDLGLVAQDGK